MYEEDTSVAPAPTSGPRSSLLQKLAISVAVIYVAVSLFSIAQLRTRVANLERDQKAAEETAAKKEAAIMKRLGMTEATIEQASSQLGSRIGQTQKEAAARASQLAKQQQAAEERLREESQKISQDVGGVKTEVAGAKTDIASTKSDLEATKSKLERAIGDLNVQSGLIAHTRDELEYVKHRGDRNIYEFTLRKGESPKPVSTISLQLKKVDAKKGKFSLNVLADDRTIEKKDRTIFEPMQFYTGRDRNLYELVIMSADKNTITGYMSTPKTIPAPANN
jgi:multidrug efflux pump subunit AcrA (membrane-fusion protein)